MDKLKKTAGDLKEELRTDPTLNTALGYTKTVPPKIIPATSEYLLDKVPIVQWLPRYNPSWLLQDFVAGLTIGVMLIPQGLAYAKIATIPIENGLYSSWIPAAVCVFMGTSKDLSSGPTSILGLLTAEIIASLKGEFTPTEISTAVAMFVGIYSLVVGCLGLGFLLDYVSAPVLTGFISATALTIGFGQVDSLVGLDDVPDKVFPIIGDVLRRLPHWNGPTCGIGFGTVFLLIALEKIGKKYGKKHFIIKYIVSSRAVIVMVIFTLISWGVNHGREEYLWEVSEVDTNGIGHPKVPKTKLLGQVGARAFAPFIACALEHLAVGKAFGRRNHYSIDQSQELNYLGVTNIVNSFFSVMPVGGAMSRTAVNSECRVRSPLYGLVTAGWILLTLYLFSPALYWLPKATLAAIIIMAVIHLFGPLSLFWRYWRVSLADFIASQVSFWVTIFVTAEIGIGAAVAWSIFWTLIRYAFVKPETATQGSNRSNNSTLSGNSDDDVLATSRRQLTHDGHGTEHSSFDLPEDTAVVKFTDSVFFPNASRAKTAALQRLQIVFPSATQSNGGSDNGERMWSVSAERKLERLRAANVGLTKDTALSVVVWDFSMVSFIDVTGIIALSELKDDIHRQLGSFVQIRMAGMTAAVRRKFERARWKLVDYEGGMPSKEVDGENSSKVGDIVYPSLERAVLDREEADASELKGVTTEKVSS